MTPNDLSKKYSLGTRIIHWGTAALVLVIFPLGKYMDELGKAEKMNVLPAHALLGILVLLLTLIRIYFYFRHKRPESVKTGSNLNDKFAVFVQSSFYYFLIILVLTGIGVLFTGGYWEALVNGTTDSLKSHGNIPLLSLHALLATVVMILLTVHVIGVFRHFILKKENIFKRIF